MRNEEEEELVAEVEAVEAVYGTDCVLLSSFPPHFHLSLKPRTADVSSQQFVEAVLEIRATSQYPKEPPSIEIVDCKGLDEQRQKHLLNYIQSKAYELSPCLMLVALCEETVEKLSAMNHPDGDCPLCLFPLVLEDQQSETLPFMKLMSCFHCFHSECIIRWWKWLQSSKEADSANTNSAAAHRNQGLDLVCTGWVECGLDDETGRGTDSGDVDMGHIVGKEDSGREDEDCGLRLVEIQDFNNTTCGNNEKMEESVGNCPVCRKPFLAKDLDHVLALVGSYSSQLVIALFRTWMTCRRANPCNPIGFFLLLAVNNVFLY
ncbi:unnamed protein product [Sphenostylis stenocarpa]|uniref:RWD domain-containing protein n=1 Tax=Sphenostylis stenocarpa TaxID=92480 RepID=A0AA86SC25_9FABA|nr:unnamed protein product [Sphenostylis stenocarpa]